MPRLGADASKPVSVEGLLLLGWKVGANGSVHYTKGRFHMGLYAYGLLGTGTCRWRFDNQTIHGKLAPRTLAEVKFLMDRMQEDA